MEIDGKEHLKYLENLLQEIGHQEEKSTLQSVEISSAYAQKQQLETEVKEVKEKLAQSLNENTQLYEKVARLNQIKAEKEKEIKSISTELNGNRHTNEALQERCDHLQSEMEQLRDRFSSALDCRTKRMISILLTRAPELDDSIILQEFQQFLKSIEKELEGKRSPLSPKTAVNQCDLSNSSSTDDKKGAFEEKIKNLEQALENKTNELAKVGVEWNEKFVVLQSNLELKTKDADQFKSQVAELEEKVILQATTFPSSSSGVPPIMANTASAAVEEEKARIKLLEENLMQMNGYADNLEMILNECATCSEKIQANYADGVDENHHNSAIGEEVPSAKMMVIN